MNVRKGVSAVALAFVATMVGVDGGAAHASGDASSEKRHKTSKATITAVVSGLPGQTADATVTADGVIDYTGQQAAFEVNETSDTGESASTALVLDGTTAYTAVPEEALAQTGGKPWIKADANEVSQSLGIDLGMLGESGDGKAMMESVGTQVEYIGKERVRGVKTKHYQVTLDFVAAAELETDPAKKQALDAIAALYGNEPVVAGVWLDRRDRVRKMSLSIDLSKMQLPAETPGQLTGTIDVTVELYEFGTDVQIDVPPADQVISLEELVAQQQQQAPAAA